MRVPVTSTTNNGFGTPRTDTAKDAITRSWLHSVLFRKVVATRLLSASPDKDCSRCVVNNLHMADIAVFGFTACENEHRKQRNES